MLSSFLIGLTLAVGQSNPDAAPGVAKLDPSVVQVGADAAVPEASPAPPTATPPAAAPPAATCDAPEEKGGHKHSHSDEPKKGFFHTFIKSYKDEFCPKEEEKKDECKKDDDKKDDEKKADECKKDDAEPEKPRRANPEPFNSPPFPTSEWQGYPDIGVPPKDVNSYAIMKGLYESAWGDAIKDSRICFYGWVTASGNFSTSKVTNTPTAYAVVPNRLELDQFVTRIERLADMSQTDHIDWGFRFTNIYGIDYRYTTAGGYGSEQLLKHNLLNGDDPLEIYGELYIPGIFDGLNIRLGRYISPPDIEAQLAPDNYLASHSILFTYDNYTQTGILGTLKLSDQWMVQAGLNAGGDMAPWYKGSLPTGFFGVRWISKSNNDSVYTCINDVNNFHYRQFDDNGVPTGHDNYNYVVSTWSHRFNKNFITSTEAYYMYQINPPLGGTPSVGPVQYGAGGGEGPIIQGHAAAYGVLNYTAWAFSKKDYITLRNEWWDDNKGMRTGFATSYSSNTIGVAHNFSPSLQVRPEVGYYHSYSVPAFDATPPGLPKKNMVEFLFDVTLRF